MKGIINEATNECEAIVEDETQYDLDGFTVAEVPQALLDTTPLHKVRWDKTTSQFFERPPSIREQSDTELQSSAIWDALRGSSPAQIETWLDNNMTNLAEARTIIKLILLAIRMLDRRTL